MKKTVWTSTLISILLATVAVGVINAQQANLVLYLPFDEGEGDKAADLSDFNNDGTVHGAVWVDGVKGSALDFDGQSYVEISDDESLDITDEITIMAWVKLPGAGGECPVVSKGPWGDQPYELTNHIGQKKAMLMMGGQICWSSTLVEFNIWYHLAGTFDGEVIKLYIDGEPAGELAWGGPMPSNDVALRIGMRPQQEAYAINGTVDEVAIYHRALSQDDIQVAIESGIIQAAVTTSSKLTTTWGSIKSLL